MHFCYVGLYSNDTFCSVINLIFFYLKISSQIVLLKLVENRFFYLSNSAAEFQIFIPFTYLSVYSWLNKSVEYCRHIELIIAIHYDLLWSRTAVLNSNLNYTGWFVFLYYLLNRFCLVTSALCTDRNWSYYWTKGVEKLL